MNRGRDEGWYVTYQGEVTDVRPGSDGVITTIRQSNGNTTSVEAQVVIDCTGLEADIREHRIFADLLDHCGAGRNPLGRLDVDPTFEARGTRSGSGRLYASGSATYGGYFEGVDTFLGLQLSAPTHRRRPRRPGILPPHRSRPLSVAVVEVDAHTVRSAVT